MLAPERRRRSDLLAAAIIVVVMLVGSAALWLGSDARGTTSEPAATPLTQPEAAAAAPQSLTELWRAISPATTTPVVAAGAVVTGDGGAVAGLNPTTGATAWRYSRDLPLCGVIGSWNSAVAVFRDDRGCSQVTELGGASGNREDQRTSDADAEVELSADGTYVTARGDTRMELWRSDLVRTLEYGRIDAPVNPGAQPRSGCTLLSSASNTSRVAVLEDCPGDSAPRLTALNPAPKDAREPEEFGSSVVAALTGVDGPVTGARVVLASGDRIALAVPAHSGTPAAITLFDGNAQPVTDFDLSESTANSTDFSRSSAAVEAGDVYSWWTGTDTVALSRSDLTPRWILPGSLGPGGLMAGRLLVPVPGGIAVVQPDTGVAERTIAVDRGDYTGPVETSILGTVVVEQRGDDVVALSEQP